MKYDERASWAIDVEIVSDKALSAAQVEFCIAQLGKAIGANGGLEYNTDEHHFHVINIWADEHADLKTIIQITCVMCSEGCRATCWDGYTEKSKRLANFDYELRKVY